VTNKDITINTKATKRCNKIRFQQFQVLAVATSTTAAFLCLIDTWYNNSQFEGENKVISGFITIEIQRRMNKKHEQSEERNEC
jgi:hypothetical protein